MVGRGNRVGEIRVIAQAENPCRRCGHVFTSVVIEAMSPVEPAVGLVPVDATQIVDHVTAGDDEDAALTQRCETRAEFEVVLEWPFCIDR